MDSETGGPHRAVLAGPSAERRWPGGLLLETQGTFWSEGCVGARVRRVGDCAVARDFREKVRTFEGPRLGGRGLTGTALRLRGEAPRGEVRVQVAGEMLGGSWECAAERPVPRAPCRRVCLWNRRRGSDEPAWIDVGGTGATLENRRDIC